LLHEARRRRRCSPTLGVQGLEFLVGQFFDADEFISPALGRHAAGRRWTRHDAGAAVPVEINRIPGGYEAVTRAGQDPASIGPRRLSSLAESVVVNWSPPKLTSSTATA